MPVISFLNQKGGVGKTTLSLHLAAHLALHGGAGRKRVARVLVVDADPQRSSLDWIAKRTDACPSPFRVVGLPTAALHREIGPMSKDYDWLLIDGPPGVTPITRSAVMASDLVVIPVRPSPPDLWAAEALEDIIAKCRQDRLLKPRLLACFVINQHSHTVLAREAPAELGRRPFPLLATVIKNRTAYAKAAGMGLTAGEVHPEGPADLEIAELAFDVTRILEGKGKAQRDERNPRAVS